MDWIGIHLWISAYATMVVANKKDVKEAPKKSSDQGAKKISNELKIFKARLAEI